MNRRAFLETLAAGAVAARHRLFAQPQAPLTVDATVLRQRIEALSAFGRPAVEGGRG